VPKGHKLISPSTPSAMPESSPNDCRDGIHWFIDNAGLYIASTRGLFATDFAEEQEAVLEAAIINLKARNVHPIVISGETLYKQADFLWASAIEQTSFGRPVASKLELDISGSDFVIVKDLEAPEASHHLWYLFHHLFYPRALFNKPVLVTSPLGYEEFVTYGAGCDDLEFAGRKVTWEKLLWTVNATTMDLPHFRKLKAEGTPPMLKAEYALFKALKERGLEVIPQHVIGDYMLDFALNEKQNKIDIEVDVFASIDHNKPSTLEVKRNLQLLNDGWKIVKFSTAEILSNVSACVDTVEEVWQQGRKKSSSGRVVSGTQPTTVPDMPVDDDAQKFAITHGAGPAAVEGGAGTGKSSCVTHRVAYLLAQGISPEKILVITYSPECVKQLRTALEASADRALIQRLSLFCWHDLGLKLLKENLSAIKRKPPVKVESNPQKALKRLLDKFKKDLDPTLLELSEDLDEFMLSQLVSLYKANLVSPKHVKERAKSEFDELVAKVYQAYEDQLQKANRVDRDDMISLAAQLLVDDAEVRAKHQYQYEFVLVDEYQDATAAGDLLARLLAFPQDNVYLVGNEDESIYETKGSLPRLMSEVSIRLPNARCYMLEKNWRSHPVIVDHARQLLNGLTRRLIQKDMISGWGAAPTTAVIGPHVSDDERAEAEWVADEIEILIDSGRTAQEIAVIYHENRYAGLLEEAISRRGIRCLTSNSQSALLPDEVGDVMAFLTLVMDPDGPKARESFERICHLRVKEVNPALSATIASFAESNNLSYLKGIEIYWQAVQDPSCRELEQLVRIIRTMHQEKLPPAETISLLKRTQRLGEYYNSIKVPPGVIYEPMRKLGILEEEARKFQSVSEFVKSQLAIQQAANGAGASEKAVHVLNIHESKGREFPVAFVIGMAQGVLPGLNTDPEEDRRLFYVAFTRAKELVYLSYPANFANEPVLPSTFLIDARLMLPPRPAQPQQITNFAPGRQTGQYPAMQQPMQGQNQSQSVPQQQQPGVQQQGTQPQRLGQQAPQPVAQQSMQQQPTQQQPMQQQPMQQQRVTQQHLPQQPPQQGVQQQSLPQQQPAQMQQTQHMAPGQPQQQAPGMQRATGQMAAMAQPGQLGRAQGQGPQTQPPQTQSPQQASQTAPQQQVPVSQRPQMQQAVQMQQTQSMAPGQPMNQPMNQQAPGQQFTQQQPLQQIVQQQSQQLPQQPTQQPMQQQPMPQPMPQPVPQRVQGTFQDPKAQSATGAITQQPTGPITQQPSTGAPKVPSNVVPANVLSGNATPANTAPGSLAPRSVKPVGGGPNTPDHYPTQPVARGAAPRETATLNVNQLPSPAELQAKIAAEAAQLMAAREIPPPPIETSQEQSSLLDDLFSGAAVEPTALADVNPEASVEDVDFPSTGPTRKGADLAPASVRKTQTKATEVPSTDPKANETPEELVPPEHLVKGFQSALAQASIALQEQAAQTPSESSPGSASAPAIDQLVKNAPTQEIPPPAMQQPLQSQAPAAQPVASPRAEQPQQPQQPPQVSQPPQQVASERPPQQVPQQAPQEAPLPQQALPQFAPNVSGQIPVSQNAINEAIPGVPAQAPQPQPAAPSAPPSRPPQNSPVGPGTGVFAAALEQRSWESPWEKEQKSQQAQSPSHRSIPATPPSVFEPPPELHDIAHHAELPLGELNLNQFSEEHNYDATPPTRGDMHHMHGEYHPPAATADQQSASTSASGKDPDDISDLLELAAKAPSKKAKGGGKSKASSKASADAAPQPEFVSDLPESGPVPDPVPYLDNDFLPAQQPQYAPQQAVQQEAYQPQTVQPQPIQPQMQQQPVQYRQPQPPQQPGVSAPQQPWGEQIQQLQQGGQLHSPPEFPDHHPRCPHCYVPLEGGSRFCGECGYTLPERIPVCQKCNTALEPGAKFCGECGAKQVDMKAPVAVASSLGITQAELANVPPEALSSTENFKRYMSAINPQGQQTWMVKLLKFLEQ
jgi:DNA helicase-2/ATP-dependent DNA helicase PcrA